MIIRKLCVNEIEQSVCLAQWTFEYCIMRRNANQQLKEIFMQYNNYENILSLFQQGRIMIWGAFDNNQMVGMGAMEAPGRISMLYVHPNCQRRGYGKALIREMQYVAYEEYKTSGYNQVGDQGTDAVGNNTSSGKPGFRSNKKATVSDLPKTVAIIVFAEKIICSLNMKQQFFFFISILREFPLYASLPRLYSHRL